MKRLLIFALLISAGISAAQTTETTNQATASIAKGLGLFVFPKNGQDQATQDKDETDCYKWAVQQTNVDPINPPQVQAAQVDRSADGTAIVGAAGGAAAGAAIGAIAGDTGKGAAIGAVLGGMRGRRAKVVGDEMEQQQNNAAAEAQEAEMMENFKKAFTACMEAKGYTVQ